MAKDSFRVPILNLSGLSALHGRVFLPQKIAKNTKRMWLGHDNEHAIAVRLRLAVSRMSREPGETEGTEIQATTNALAAPSPSHP